MVWNLITLPFRVGAFAARTSLHVTEDALTGALSATHLLLRVIDPREPRRAAGREQTSSTLRADIVIAVKPPIAEEPPDRPPSPPRDNGRSAQVVPEVETAQGSAEVVVTEPETAPSLEPTHVSEEPELVAAFAEPGAEDGAGASVHIEEPWRGYGQMSANEVIGRLGQASREEMAAVALYERSHRHRSTVMAAADQQLKRATAAARDHR